MPKSKQLFVKEIREPNRMIPIGFVKGDMIDLQGIEGTVVKDYEEYSSKYLGEKTASKLSNFILSDEMVEEFFYPDYYTMDEEGNYSVLDENKTFFFEDSMVITKVG